MTSAQDGLDSPPTFGMKELLLTPDDSASSRRERTSQRRERDPNHKNAKAHAVAYPTVPPQQNGAHDRVDTRPEG